MNLRSNRVPINMVALSSNDSTPEGYIHEDRLNNKYATGVPNNTSNPNSSVGTAEHHHGLNGSHAHTSTNESHSHSALTESGGSGGGRNRSDHHTTNSDGINHKHTISSNSKASNVSVTDGGSHNHGNTDNNPASKTIRHVRYNPSSLPLRTNGFDSNIMLLWENDLDGLDYDVDTNYFDKFLKQVENKEVNSFVLNGSNTHNHGNGGSSHRHLITNPTHAHTLGDTSRYAYLGDVSGGNPAGSAHSHSTPGVSITESGNNATNSSNTNGHLHSSKDNTPLYKTFALFTNNRLNLRSTGIPKNSISMWLESVSNIPEGFNNYESLFKKYIRIIPNLTTNPGSTGGLNDNHSEESVTTTHSHTGSFYHTHNIIGTTNSAGGGNSQLGDGNQTSLSHTHSINTSVNSSSNHTLSSVSNTHDHDGASNRPLSITVAFIKKL